MYLVCAGITGIGSPPRAWGQSEIADEDVLALRFTPTGVGTIRPGLG